MKTIILMTLSFCILTSGLYGETQSASGQTQIQAPTTDPNAGRKGKTNDAASLAMFGAAIAGASCVMLMKQAMKQPPGSMERAMLMSQAMQQCAQAMKSAADGQSNDDIADYLTSQGVDVAELKPQEATVADSREANTDIPSSTSPVERGIAAADTKTVAPVAAQTASKRTALSLGEPQGNSMGFGPTDMMDSTKITFDDSAIGSGGETSGGGIATLVGGGKKGEIDFDAVNKATRDEIDELHRRKRQITDSENGAIAGDAASAAAGGEEDFASLMGSFMGGNAEADSSLASADNDQILSFGDDSNLKKVNIFQYASYRYKTLAQNEGRIQSRFAVGLKF